MFKTNPIRLSELLDQAGNGKIQLPDFQRGWVWDDDRIKGLLASVSRGFPVGAILTLEAGGEIRLRSRLIEGIEGVAENGASAFLLDGQQRLTSLYQALRHTGPVETRDNRRQRIKRWYYLDMLAALDPEVDREDAIVSVPENRLETSNFGREVVRDLSRPDLEYRHHMMPVERLLDSRRWITGYTRYWEDRDHPEGSIGDFLDRYDTVLDIFVGYELPIISLDRDTPKEAICTVFEKVNTGGVVLSMFELVTASFAAQDDDFSLRDDWNERQLRLAGGYGVLQGISGDQFLQAVALLATQERRRRRSFAGDRPTSQAPAISCRKSEILGLDVADYHQWADKVEAGFVDAAKFLGEQFVFTAKDVPYTTQIVPLAALFVELGAEGRLARSRALLERWFWSGIFGEVYSSAVETQFAADLDQVARWIRGEQPPPMVSEANFSPDRLLSLRSRNSAAYKGLYALQMKSRAADWRTGKPLSFQTWHEDRIDIHHIFPKRWCERDARPQIPKHLYNSIVNKTPIDAHTNRTIGGDAPSVYLARLRNDHPTPSDLDQVLITHWLNPVLLAGDRFADCFVERGESMLALIGEAMGKRIDGGREALQLAVVGLAQPSDEFDDQEDEHDPVGERAYEDAGYGAGRPVSDQTASDHPQLV